MRILLTRIWLVFVAAYPVFIASVQILDFMMWMSDNVVSSVPGLLAGTYSPVFLAATFIASIRERFCTYHRLCIASVFILNINHTWAFLLAPAVSNGISSVLILCAMVGIIGAVVHFYYQIDDFIRYARIQSKKQDSGPRTLRTQ